MFLEAGTLLCTPYAVVVTDYKTQISVNFLGTDSVVRNRSMILCVVWTGCKGVIKEAFGPSREGRVTTDSQDSLGVVGESTGNNAKVGHLIGFCSFRHVRKIAESDY